ncbi:DUF1549 domain-containing protein [Zavarzinella formosa]|uniref:DUF1549 domain-containing protein n=1 Tax=Zavarzinella formosa TaxID=360055 RepID=UPI000368C1B5|nr:DUF1549 domain-containing protein [Zavarzinella formosa]
MRPNRLVLLLATILPSFTVAADLLPPDRPIESVIDHYIDARLATSKSKAVDQADDYTLIRRLTLDLVGRIPTPAESKAFVESKDAKKREQLVDRLMASGAFVRHQANQFDAMISGPSSRTSGIRDYLVKALGSNKSWDVIFRELLVPNDDDAATKGSGEYLKTRITDLDRVTNDVSVTFFGVNVSCAQCHDHPLVQDWKQDHFFGMKSFFARSFDNGGFLAERDDATVKFKPTKGPEKTAKMMFLTGKTFNPPARKEQTKEEEIKERQKFEQAKKDKKSPPPPSFSARAKLVEIALQTEEAVFFSKAISNRLWHRFLGYGLVMPLDQMHSENPASHPELLQWLGRDMANHQYDLRRMIRGIVLSKTYSRSSKWTGDIPPAPGVFAVAQLKPLTPMQLAASMRVAVADPATFEGKPEDVEKRLESIENSARGFAGNIAAPTDDFQIGVSEALLFSNSDRVEKEFLNDGGDRLIGKLKTIKDPTQAVELMISSTLCRPATPDEKKLLTEYLQRRTDRSADAQRQILWSLLSGAEFRFNY